MPEIGPMELLVVAVVALLVFGPEKLPEMAKNVGRTISDLRRTAQEMRDEFSSGLEDDEPPRRRTRPVATEDPDDDSDYVVEDEPPGTAPRPPNAPGEADEDIPPPDPEVDPAGEGPAPPGGETPDEDPRA
jgi:Tat protein translocase TatB subunit